MKRHVVRGSWPRLQLVRAFRPRLLLIGASGPGLLVHAPWLSLLLIGAIGFVPPLFAVAAPRDAQQAAVPRARYAAQPAAVPDAARLLAAAEALRRGPCRPAGAQAPLRRRAELDGVARGFAAGRTLGEALQRAGFVATQSAGLQLRGARDDAGLRRLIERQFCSQLASAELSEAGAWVQGDRAWLVLSTPPLPAASGGYNRSGLVSGTAAPDPASGRGEVLALVNAARAGPRRCGERDFGASPPLQPSATLARVAQRHAEDMARGGYFDHTAVDGSTPQQRIDRSGYAWSISGENLALGRMSAREAVDGWLASPGHCANIMDPRFTETGIALAVGRGRDRPTYWVQTFAAPKLR